MAEGRWLVAPACRLRISARLGEDRQSGSATNRIAALVAFSFFVGACGSSESSDQERPGVGGAIGVGGVSSGGTGGAAVGSGGAGVGGVLSTGGVTSIGGTNETGGVGGFGEGGIGGAGGTPPQDAWPLVNGLQWADTDGNPIQAHGGGVLRVGDDYYWFGENRNPDGTFFAVSAYRSRDLLHWEFRNHVLRMTTDPDLNPANIERPKVVYNDSTNKYVMWMHWENGQHYGEARAAVASSDTIDGDYTYHGSSRPYAGSGVIDHDRPGYMSRDCTLFVDDDGSGYFISATNENLDLNLYLLTPDYLEVDHLVATLFSGGHREAPALFKRQGVYFLLTSGATGWDPNQAKYATSTALDHGWSSMTNIGDGTTFHSQSTYVLEVQGDTETSYLYMGDRWAGAWSGRVNDSLYVWLPLAFPASNQMTMGWSSTLELDAARGQLGGNTGRLRLVNVASGLWLDVENGSTENSGDIVQRAASSDASQRWTFDYDGAGYYRITNEGSGKVLDVPDESTEDGIALIQWDSHGGDNQSWRPVPIGNGNYRIINENSGKYMGVVSASVDEGAAIEQRALTNGDEQVWSIEIAP